MNKKLGTVLSRTISFLSYKKGHQKVTLCWFLSKSIILSKSAFRSTAAALQFSYRREAKPASQRLRDRMKVIWSELPHNIKILRQYRNAKSHLVVSKSLIRFVSQQQVWQNIDPIYINGDVTFLWYSFKGQYSNGS